MDSLSKYQRGTGAHFVKNTQKDSGVHLNRVQSSKLHFHMPNIEVSPPQIIENAKSQILSDFVYGFAKMNAPSCWQLQNINFEQLQSLLKVWTSSGAGSIAGDALSRTITEKLQDDPYTGSGIIKGFRDNFGKDIDFNSLSGTDVLDQADYVFKQIEILLASYIEVFFRLEEPALLDKSFQLYKQGQSMNPAIFSKYNMSFFSNIDQKNIDKKAASNFQELEQILKTLNEVAQMGKSGMTGQQISAALTTKNASLTFDPESLSKSVGSLFNALGGEQVGEIVGSYAAWHLKNKETKEIKEIIEKLFNVNGFVTVNTDKTLGQTLAQLDNRKIQQKGDWAIVIRDGSIIIKIPVSQKLYQSGRNVKGNNKGYSSAKTLPKRITAQAIGLNSLLSMTLLNPQEGISWFEQHLAVLSSDNSDVVNMSSGDSMAVNLWNDFKEAAQWIGLFRALVGTGAKTSQGIDFAGLLIVNNQIFSIADILLALTNNQSRFIYPNIPNFNTMRQSVVKNYPIGTNMRDIDIEKRMEDQMGKIRTLWGKKFKFEIDMAMAASL